MCFQSMRSRQAPSDPGERSEFVQCLERDLTKAPQLVANQMSLSPVFELKIAR